MQRDGIRPRAIDPARRDPPGDILPDRRRLRRAGTGRACWPTPGSSADRRRPGPGRRRRGGVGPAQSAGRPAAALPRAGEAGDLPVHERRPVARRHLRPQAGAGEVRRPGPAGLGRRPAAARRGKIMPSPFAARPHGAERHRGHRALPARRRLHRRHLRAPLDVHRQPEPRAVAADDELGQHAADPAQPRLVADLRPGDGEPEPARASWCSARASRSSARSCGAAASCRASTRARTSATTSIDPDRIIRDVTNRHLSRAAQRDAARPAPGAEPRAPRTRAATTRRSRPGSRRWRWPSACSSRRARRSTSAASRRRRDQLYGDGEFANACLIARRLVERGVRVVQVYYGSDQPWDDHADINQPPRPRPEERPADRRAARRT